ncbi:MAG: DUF1289 domain-containing protein [Gammaproteobacteria bacterium]|jgi:predicted Fe-S protein YdhL (DUF1289 family)
MSAPIDSPCVAVCQIDTEMNVCRGCFRTLTEIANWGRMSPIERRAIMQRLPQRQNDPSFRSPNH